MPKPVTFFYDFLSPYSYLAFHQMTHALQDDFTQVDYRPIATLWVMKEVNNTPTTLECPTKARYAQQDLIRWATRYQAPFARNPYFGQFDPTPLYLTALAAAHAGQLDVYNRAIFQAVWVDGVNLGDTGEHLRVLNAAGIKAPEALLDAAAAPDMAKQLDANNRLAVSSGVFGVPSFIVNETLYFGNDRLDFVTDALRQ